MDNAPMKHLILALAFIFAPSIASAQCNGVFPPNTFCGNTTGTTNPPGAMSLSVIPGGNPGGVNPQIQYNNGGAFGGLTDVEVTARIQAATSSLSGALPAWPNNTTTFFRGDGTYQSFASPPAIGGTSPAAGSFSSLKAAAITGSTQCVQADSSGVLSGTGAVCGGSASACSPIESFGGGVGVTDNVAALNAAVAAFGTGGGCIAFGVGVYRFASATTITYPATSPYSVTFQGLGQDVTIIEQTGNTSASGMFNLALNHINQTFHFHDMTIATALANNGRGIASVDTNYETFATSDIRNVTFRGMDGPGGTGYWTAGYFSRGMSQVVVSNINVFGGSGITGIGVDWAGGTNSSQYSFGFQIINSNFNGVATGIQLGDFWQTILVSTCNFGTVLGIAQLGSTSGILLNLNVINSQFSPVTGGIGIGMSSPIFQATISSNFFFTSISANGIQCNPCGGGTITGNNFQGQRNGDSGISIISNTTLPFIISGNLFYTLALGIGVTAGTSPINIMSNAYGLNTTNIASGGTIHVGGSCAGIGGTCTAGSTN